MTPLDLAATPPRPCRDALDGILYLPRHIDKLRAALPGGNLGSYVVTRDEFMTLSAAFFRRFRVSFEENLAAVAAASGDADVVTWLRARTDPADVEKWNATLLKIRIADVQEPARTAFFASHPNSHDMPESALLIDALDAEDSVAKTPEIIATAHPRLQ